MLFENEELLELAQSLNKEQSLPPKAFRRDVQIYELVSYINNIIGCCVSNYEKPIPVLIERVRVFGSEHSDLVAETEYFTLASKFVDCLEAQLDI